MSTTGRTQHGQPKPRPALATEAYSPRTRSNKPIPRSAPPKPTKEDGTSTYLIHHHFYLPKRPLPNSNTPFEAREGDDKRPQTLAALCFLRPRLVAHPLANFGWLSLSTTAADCALTAHFITSHYALCLTAALLPDGGAVIRGEFKLGTPDLACSLHPQSPGHLRFFPTLTLRSLSGLSLRHLRLSLPYLSEANGYLLPVAVQSAVLFAR